MRGLFAAALLFTGLLSCASPAPEPVRPPSFGKALATELDSMDAHGPDIAHVDGTGRLWVYDAERPEQRPLESDLNRAGFEPTTAARGLAADRGTLRWEWLAILSRAPGTDLAVLSIHDRDGRLAHEEVLLEDCSGMAWREGETPELLVGCFDHVWRYLPGPSSEAALTPAQFATSGDAFGPLRFGDTAARVRAALQLAGGSCLGDPCTAWGIRLGERGFRLVPHLDEGSLARVTVIGPRRRRAEWRTEVRADWRALVSEVAGGTGAGDVPYPAPSALVAIPGTPGVSFAQTHQPEHAGVLTTIGLYRNEGGDRRGFGAIAVISPSSPAVPAPAAPANQEPGGSL